MPPEVICPRCQNRNPTVAQFCNFCGAPLKSPDPPQPPPPPPPQPPPGPYQPPPPAPHYPHPAPGPYPPPYPPRSGMDRSTLALILGIISILACGPFTGIPGIIIARSEMAAIREGRAPATGMDKAKWGFYLSIAGSILAVVCTCAWFAMSGMGYLPWMMM